MNDGGHDRRQVLRYLAAVGAIGAGALASPPVRARGVKLGAPAPAAVLVTLDGQRIATRDLLGQVVILTFWATYCGPCREELPLLSDYAAAHEKDGLKVLGFALDDADQAQAVREVGRTLSFPVGFLREDSAPGYGRIWRIPANFTIDRAGRLVDNSWNRKDAAWTRETLEHIVTPLLSAT